jgi:flagellar biosynthesis/type III secretory pathway chaperone
MNASIRAHNLIELMDDLLLVLERENQLLETPRASELSPVVAEKQALFKHYQDHIEAISQDPGFSAALPDELRAQLQSLAETFEALMAVNKRKLEILTKSSQHVVDRIIEAAKQAAGEVPGYGSKGTAYNGRAAAPIAMNQEI